MARKKKEPEGGGGAPAWMATFSDLMNLLLCFFVLLFASSTVDAEKYELIVASLQSSFSVLPSGGSAIIDNGDLVGMGISQLSGMDIMHTAMLNTAGNNQDADDGNGETSEKTAQEKMEEQGLEQSEKLADQVKEKLKEQGLMSDVQVDFNAQYAMLTINGAMLFDSGSVDVKPEATTILKKIGTILENYNNNIIEIEGHTDNVPVSSGSRYKSNDMISSLRALSVADYLRTNFKLDPANVKHSGRGEYVPIADNSTPEGRAQNRRVEIKLFNTLNSSM